MDCPFSKLVAKKMEAKKEAEEQDALSKVVEMVEIEENSTPEIEDNKNPKSLAKNMEEKEGEQAQDTLSKVIEMTEIEEDSNLEIENNKKHVP